MRLLFHDCAPFMGGAQESLWTLLHALRQRTTHDLMLACACPELAGRAEEARIPVRLLQAGHWPASPRGLCQLWRDRQRNQPLFAALQRDFRPDLVHLNTCRAALLFPQLDARCLIHDRDLRLPRLVPAWLARRRPGIIAISQAVARKWRPFTQLPLHVFPNMFDIPSLARQATPPASPHDAPLVVMVADLVPWKGHDVFLEALAELKRSGRRFQALVRGRVRDDAGAALLARLQQRRLELHLTDVLAFDDQPGAALPAIARADLLVSTADQEPFGRTVVEALALGKPIVAVAGGGVTDILADCPAATLVSPQPQLPQAVAAAMAQWLPPAQRPPAIAQAAQQRARQFDIDTLLPRFIDILQRQANP